MLPTFGAGPTDDPPPALVPPGFLPAFAMEDRPSRVPDAEGFDRVFADGSLAWLGEALMSDPAPGPLP